MYQWVILSLPLPPPPPPPLSLSLSLSPLSPQDNQRIVDTLKTGFPIPGNLDFDEYQGKHNKKSAQKKSKVSYAFHHTCTLLVVGSLSKFGGSVQGHHTYVRVYRFLIWRIRVGRSATKPPNLNPQPKFSVADHSYCYINFLTTPLLVHAASR